MLNYLYTEEEKLFQAEIQQFVKKEIYPHAIEIEKGKYPREVLRLLGKIKKKNRA